MLLNRSDPNCRSIVQNILYKVDIFHKINGYLRNLIDLTTSSDLKLIFKVGRTLCLKYKY